MHAMVVDDSKAMRVIISKMLGQKGFDVKEAANGQEAMDSLEADYMPDIMLVDWNMPVMNGYELIEAVRKDDKYKDVTIIMVTTEAEIDHMQKALEAGANEYIMKPFTKDVIEEKLSMLGVA